jgi:hypothetical protein
MKGVKAISPNEIMENLDEIIPDFVIESVNSLLKKKFRGSAITIKQDELIKEIKGRNPSVNREELFNNKWLDFESLFEESGWSVKYDKPGYRENYDAYFEFTPKK